MGNMRKGIARDKVLTALNAEQLEHFRFESDILSLEASVGQTSKTATIQGTQINFEYTVALNGVAITTDSRLEDKIAHLDYVSGIFRDDTVRVVDDSSNAVIGAPEYWSTSDEHGEGIDIGIIDTGIDYLHEALGDAPFPNAKVVGGYNLAYGNADPMDDNGHGTHVSGIAAGYGPAPYNLRGVAYMAKLWAFKVLDSTGTGYMSTVIAGIERALDPDQDPTTPTPIDVISMSLGGVGDADDAASQAVDNAVNSGVMCAVAAGNWGPGESSISSPGTARLALTVGASTDEDGIADFSSCGPAPITLGIKPDIVAPGVNVYSSVIPNNTYAYHSGTSMATPHVAGAAALLRQLHPDWTALEIRAALIESARDLGYDPLTQGSGRLSIPDAAQRTVVVNPTSASFGVDDLTQSVWESSTSFQFSNKGTDQKQYKFHLQTPNSGVKFSFNPSSVTVPPGQSASVTAYLAVNNSSVPNSDTFFVGKIFATENTSLDTISLPFGFFKQIGLTVFADETPLYLAPLFPQLDFGLIFPFVWYYSPHPDTLFLYDLPQGLCDCIGLYFDLNTFIIKENVQIGNTGATIHVRKSDAKNTIILDPLDRFGNALPHFPIWWNALVDTNENGIGDCWQDPYFSVSSYPDTLFFPNASTNYHFEADFRGYDSLNNSYYQVPLLVGPGFSSSQVVQNAPSQFQHLNLEFADKIESQPVSFLPAYAPYGTDPYFPERVSTSILNVYMLPRPSPVFLDSSLTGTVFVGGETIYMGAIFVQNSGEIQLEYNQGLLQVPNNSTVKIGYGAPRWNGFTENGPSAIQVVSNGFLHNFWNYSDLEAYAQHYNLYFNGVAIDSGVGVTFGYGQSFAPGVYQIEMPSFPYQISGLIGTATTRLEFDLRRANTKPPLITWHDIIANGIYADEIEIGDSTRIDFTASGVTGIDSGRVFFQPLGSGTTWIEGITIRSGNTFTIPLPGNLPDGYTSMRFRAVDSSGNAIDNRMEPAFLYHRAVPPPPLLTYPAANDTSQSIYPTLRWQGSLNPISYHLQVAHDTAFGSIVLDNSSCTQNSQRIGPLQRLTRYYWRVSAKNLAGIGSYSAASSFATSVDSTYSFPVGALWNLVSVPYQTSSPLAVAAFSQAVSSAYTFDGSSYVSFDTLQPGVGYWLKFRFADTLFASGTPLNEDTIEVEAGWNLIGSISYPIAAENISSVPSGISLSNPFTYSHGEYVQTETIQAGKGYWVKAGGSGKLIFSKSSIKDATSRVKITACSDYPPPPPENGQSTINRIPKAYSLESNYPNPFNPTTTISYALPRQSMVRLKVFNILGQEVSTLVNGVQSAGEKEVQFNAVNLPSGVYFYRLEAGTFTSIKKLVLIK
jgi:hypothetical protein